MYRLAKGLGPETIYQLSHYAFVELALCGVTAVGEFHYVHHQPDGTPYDDRTELADAVVRAARDAGLRISLLRVLYQRAGAGKEPQGAQLRFSDHDVAAALSDVDTLSRRYQDDPAVAVGIAPHSIRAVPMDSIVSAADHARGSQLPFHMHVAEQKRELDESIAEYGAPPVRALAERGAIDDRFVAVHATHLEDDEVAVLGQARAFACICRTTERDLGDGLCRAADLVNAGVRLCTGVDSHASSDPFEEARAIELDDRSRTETRHSAADATALLVAASRAGYDAIGLGWEGDQVVLNGQDPALCGIEADHLDDAVVFAAGPRAVKQVVVAGDVIVEDGRHPGLQKAQQGYREALALLTSS